MIGKDKAAGRCFMDRTVMDRPTTGAIKGIALILMFVHHFFTYPKWYISGISYPALEGFAEVFNNPTKLCVSLFAFLTGWFFASGKDRSLGYVIRKIKEFLTTYWTVYLILMVIAMMMGCYQFGLSEFVYELAGVFRPVMIFCWYVHFYCTSMLLLSVLDRFSRNTFFGDFLLMLVIPALVMSRLLNVITSSFLLEMLSALYEWFPCTASGFLAARHRLYRRTLCQLEPRRAGTLLRCLYLSAAALLAALGRSFAPTLYLFQLEVGWTMDMVYAAVFVYACDQLLQMCRNTPVFSLLGKVGKHSTIMWFVHGIFFNVCKSRTQMLLYWPRDPLLVLLNGLLICMAASCILSVPVGFMQKLRQKAESLLSALFSRKKETC